MPKHEIAIAVKDEADNAFGKYRKKEGDIITVRPYPWNWGRKEIDEYLIVIVECSSDIKAMRTRLMKRLFSDGHVAHITFRHMDKDDGIDETIYPAESYALSLPLLQPILHPVCIGRNKYKILLAELGAIDKVKVQDKEYIYQPFKSEAQLVAPFDGLNGNIFLHRSEVDCAAPGIMPDEEKSFLWDSTNQLVQDKTINDYIKPV